MDYDWLPYDLKQRRRAQRQDRHRNKVKGWLPILIFGSCGALSIGVGIMEMGAGQMTELVCTRSIDQTPAKIPNQTPRRTVRCDRTITTGLVREKTLIIQSIESARIQQVGRKFRNAYRVILVTNAQEVPLTEDFKSDERETEQHTQEINDFIQQSSKPQIELQVDDRAQSNLFGLMFISTGCLWVLMAIVVQIAVNRKTVLIKKVS